jgi:hypothetical protein
MNHSVWPFVPRIRARKMVIMTDEPRLATAHLTEIGKLTVLTAQIEHHLAGITAMLISPTVSEVGYKVVGKQHFTTLAPLRRGSLLSSSRMTVRRLTSGIRLLPGSVTQNES